MTGVAYADSTAVVNPGATCKGAGDMTGTTIQTGR